MYSDVSLEEDVIDLNHKVSTPCMWAGDILARVVPSSLRDVTF
jgi:hypothetical protein